MLSNKRATSLLLTGRMRQKGRCIELKKRFTLFACRANNGNLGLYFLTIGILFLRIRSQPPLWILPCTRYGSIYHVHYLKSVSIIDTSFCNFFGTRSACVLRCASTQTRWRSKKTQLRWYLSQPLTWHLTLGQLSEAILTGPHYAFTSKLGHPKISCTNPQWQRRSKWFSERRNRIRTLSIPGHYC